MKRLISNAVWPRDSGFRKRFFVGDLTPGQRPQLHDFRPKMVFVAESPHVSEVTPEALSERRPLCGKAGQAFWKMIAELVLKSADTAVDTSLECQLALCRAGGFAVMNAVQFPLDPKVMVQFPRANPVENLGFSKVPPASYKKLRAGRDVEHAVEWLRERLVHPAIGGVPVVSLGGDAEWFVAAALGEAVGEGRHLMKIPHPSAWWRQGGKLREKARGQLADLLREPAGAAHGAAHDRR